MRLEIGIGDSDWGLALGIGIGDWYWGLGVGMRDLDWGFGLEIGCDFWFLRLVVTFVVTLGHDFWL